MMRRLFFLLPGNKQAGKLAVDLKNNAAIKQHNIHAVVKDDMQIFGVDDVHNISEPDSDDVIEWWVWRINLAVFFFALFMFVIMLITSTSYWLIIPAVIMFGTFISGLLFVLKIPRVHIKEHLSAIRHGETLMMVDVTPSQVYAVGHFIHIHHPDAFNGGVSWHR